MIQCVPVQALAPRTMWVTMEELEGNDPGPESSGYVEALAESTRREELKAAEARRLLLSLPGR